MTPVRTMQKYKCDFCKKRGVKSFMERHEVICFRNPNRYCECCDNKGFFIEEAGDYRGQYPIKVNCPYCSKFDRQMLKEIEEREKQESNNDHQ